MPNDDGRKVEAAAESQTSLIAFQPRATVADNARAGALEALRTTTTLPPHDDHHGTAPAHHRGAHHHDDRGAHDDRAARPAPRRRQRRWLRRPQQLRHVGRPRRLRVGRPLGLLRRPYYGGLQFSLSTWRSVGGTGYPYEHSRETQIHFGQILQARSGWGQWPHCSSELGLR